MDIMLPRQLLALVFIIVGFVDYRNLNADAPQKIARTIIGAEAFGQGIWYSARFSYRFREQLLFNAGHSYIEIPATNADNRSANFNIIPVSVSALWQLPFTRLPLHAELLFGGNIVIGSDRTERTGVRATVTGQSFTPIVGFAIAYLPLAGGITLRGACYLFQGIDSIGIESRRLPWLGASLGYAL